MRKWMKKFAVTLTILLVILGNYGLPIFSLVVQADEQITFKTEIIQNQFGGKSIKITGIEGDAIPSDHTLVIPDQLMVDVNGEQQTLDVTEIGYQAFMDKQLTSVTLGSNIRKVWPFAFANNQIKTLVNNGRMVEIGDYAFRDNQLSELSLQGVESVGQQAFANNKLTKIDFSSIFRIGDEAFIFNQLTTVNIADSLATFGKSVFGFNNRFVEVKTDSPLIKSEIVPNGYGHVVNPVTVTVQFLKPDGTKLTEDQKIGNDFYDYNGIVLIGKENTYKPQPMLGYMPEKSEIKYTPDSANYVLTVHYIEAKKPTIQEKTALSIQANSQLDEAAIKAFFKATDFTGKDISDRISIDQSSISSTGKNTGDQIPVTVTVSDDYGKTTSKAFHFVVAPSLSEFVLGKIDPDGPDTPDNQWTIGDFGAYDGVIRGILYDKINKLASLNGRGQLILPHMDRDGNPIIGVTDQAFKGDLDIPIARIDDYADNIEYIGANSLSRFKVANFTPDMLANLKRVGYGAIGLSASATELNHPSIEEVGINPPYEYDHMGYKFKGSSFIYEANNDSPGLTVNLPNLKILRDDIVTYRAQDTNYSFDSRTLIDKHLITITPATFANVEKIIIDENVSEFGMMKATKVDGQDKPAVILSDELTMNRLQMITSAAFGGISNPSRSDDRVVIRTTNTSLPSGAHYIINPQDTPEDDSTINYQFREDDFIYDTKNDKRLLGFTQQGLRKLIALSENSSIAEMQKVLQIPDKVQIIAKDAFNGITASNIRKISASNVTKIEDGGFKGLFHAKRLDLDFPKVEFIGEKAFTFDETSEIDQMNFPNLVDLYHHNFVNMRFLNAFTLPKLKVMHQSSSDAVIKKKEGGSFYHSYFATPIDSLTFPSLEKIEGLQFISGERVTHNDNYFYAKEMNFPSLQTIDLDKYYKNKDLVSDQAGDTMSSSNSDIVNANYDVTYFGGKIEKINIGKNFEGVDRKGDYWRPTCFVTFVVPDGENKKGTIVLSKNKDVPDELASINKNVPTFPEYALSGGYDYPPRASDFPNVDVNPRKVIVKYVDANNNEIAAPTEFYMKRFYGTDDSDVYPKIIKGYYPVAGKEIVTLGDGRIRDDKTFNVENETQKYVMTRPLEYGDYTADSIAESTIIYTYQPDSDLGTTGVQMKLSNEKRMVNGTEESVERYPIGNVMLSTVKLDTTLVNLDEATIYLNYDPKYVENIKVATYGTVESYKVDSSLGLVTIKLGKINASTSIEIPVQWKFKKFVTPQNYKLTIDGHIRGLVRGENTVKKLALDGPIYLTGYYNQPIMRKMSPQNMPDYDYGNSTEEDDGIRYFGEYERIQQPNGEWIYRIKNTAPVEFSYQVKYLERNIGKTVIEDTLPTYQIVKDDGTFTTATAEFKPGENPGWHLSDDGTKVTYELNDTKEITDTDDISNRKMISKNDLPKLYLRFPNLQLDTNVNNTAKLYLTPENGPDNEPVMEVTDGISIYQSVLDKVLPTGEIHYFKDNDRKPWSYYEQAYFYDILKDREKEIPFMVQTAAKNKTITFKRATITDYNLDNRLYYSGIDVSKDTSIRPRGVGGFIQGINDDSALTAVTVRAYSQTDATKLDPANDKILQQFTLPMTVGTKIDFDPKIAKEISYVQIVFPEDYVVNEHLIRFNLYTKLRDPQIPQYDSDPLSNKNVYLNESVLSGDALSKFDGTPASSHENSFSTANKPYQSLWDHLKGNFLWHDMANVLIRPYSPSVSLIKDQTTDVPEGMIATPGNVVNYGLKLDARVGGIEYDINQDMGYKFRAFRLLDLLPIGLNIRDIRLTTEFAKQKNARYQIIDNYNHTGRQAILFTADEVPFGLKNVANVSTEIDVAVPNVQTLINEAYLTYANNGDNINGENDNIYMNGSIASPLGETDSTKWIKQTASLELIKNREVIAKKYIRNVDRTNGTFGSWTTDTIETPFLEKTGKLGADFEYRLVISNDTQDTKKNISIVDILPFKDDKSIQELNFNTGAREERKSKFHNYLDTSRAITITKGSTTLTTVDASQYTIRYDNAAPYSYDYTNVQDIQGVLDQINWSTTANEQTKAIKIDGTQELVLAKGERLEIIIPMKAPATGDGTQEVHSGDIAYNSFIRKDDSTLRYIEANKVGNHLAITKSIEFTKYLKEGINGVVSTANATTAQATFELNDTSGTIHQIAKTDSSGKVRFTNLPVENDYRINEVQAPNGYQSSIESMMVHSTDFGSASGGYHDVSLTYDQEMALLNTKDYTGSVRIHKKDSNGQNLAGIRFSVTGTLARQSENELPRNFSQVIVTNEQGIAELQDLPEGSYTIEEIVDNENTDFDSADTLPASFVISSDPAIRESNKIAGISTDGRNFTYELTNNKAHIVLQKLGVTQESELASLANLTDTDKVKLPNYEFTLADALDNTKTVTTDANGQAKVSNLAINKVYSISENQTAVSDSTLPQSTNKGYKWNKKKYYFKINEQAKLIEVDNFNGDNPREFKQNVVNFPNLRKKVAREIEVVKTDQENQPLPGVVFGLYQNERLLQTATTRMDDTNQKAHLLFDNLLPGTYVIRELKAPVGFIASGNDRVVTIPEDTKLTETTDQNASVTNEAEVIRYHYTANFINYKIKAKVYKGELLLNNVSLAVAEQAKRNREELIVQDLKNGFANVYLPLEGIEFNLYEQEGSSWNYLATYRSDEHGEIDLTTYPFVGTKNYRLIETKGLPDYRLDTTPIDLSLPTLSKQTDFNGEIKLYKANQKILGRIIVSKYGEDADIGGWSVLANMTFELYDTNNHLLKTADTDWSGIAVFDQLENGEYIVKEKYTDISQMYGFEPNNMEYHVTINADTKTVQVVYKNVREKTLRLSVTKKWFGDNFEMHYLKRYSSEEGEDISVNPMTVLGDFNLNMYVLIPAIDDAGNLVYRYFDSQLDGYNYPTYYSLSNNNWPNKFSTEVSVPELHDPYQRDYKITEYSPYVTSTDVQNKDRYAETALISGYEVPVFTEGNQSSHAIRVGYNRNQYNLVRPNSDYVTKDGENQFTLYNVNYDVVSVGDYVFIDQNNNHLQDVGEEGLAGVKVTITTEAGNDPTYYNTQGESVTAPYTTTTNDKGYYKFINLVPGRYKIHFELTDAQKNRGYTFVNKTVGDDQTIDSNADPTTGWTDSFDLQYNPDKTANPNGDFLDNPTIDAGVSAVDPLVSLGDYVFIDRNNNNIQDSTDQPLKDVTVQVLTENGANPEWFNGTNYVTEPYTTKTDEKGHYQFTNLRPGTYKVKFTLNDSQKDLYAYVTPNVGENDALDSDAIADLADAKVGLTEAKAVTVNPIPEDTANAPNPLKLNDPTFDAGVRFVPENLVSLGDYAFIDMDNNNIQSQGDLPLANVKVKVVTAEGKLPTYMQEDQLVTKEYTTLTNSQGHYRFDQLVPGSYKVIFELSESQRAIYQFVQANQGENDALDSDAMTSIPKPYLAETQAHEVRPPTVPTDTPEAPNPLALNDPTFDAGVRLNINRLVSLGDYVFVDVDRSGTQTKDDQPLANVRVEVRNGDGSLPTYLKDNQLVTSEYISYTNTEGRYRFDNLLPGKYKVYFTLNDEQKEKYEFTTPNVGDNDAIDSDGVVIDPLQPERAVTDEDEVVFDPYKNDLEISAPKTDDYIPPKNPIHVDNPRFDAGVVPKKKLVSVGDKVFIDRDNSQTQTTGDRPLAGVTVQIVKVNADGSTTDPTHMQNGGMITAPYITKTDADGLYSFVDLEPGDYQIIFTLTDEQKSLYHFITPEVGGVPSLDSDAHVVEGTDGKVGKSKVIHLVEDPFTRNGDNNPLHLDNPTIDAGVAGPDYELPGAGKMELWFWYLASISILAVGLICVFSRRKQQEMSVQAQAVTTMTSKRFTNIRQNTERFDIMDTGEVADVNTSSTYFADDQIRQSEVTVSNSQNNESSTNPIVAQEKDVGSSSQFGDVAVDDPPPEQSTKVKQNANDPFSSS